MKAMEEIPVPGRGPGGGNLVREGREMGRRGSSGRSIPRWHLHRRLYEWVLHWAETPYGSPALAVLAAAESSFFPVPPDVLLIALVLGRRERAWRFATVCALASVVGGVVGYGIGAGAWSAGLDRFFFDHVPGFTRDHLLLEDGRKLEGLITSGRDEWPIRFDAEEGSTLAVPRRQVRSWHPGTYTRVRWAYQQWNFWVVFTAGFTPLPYKVITITAGVFRINFLVFLVASAVSRSARFFLVAGLLWWAGPTMKRWIERYFNWVSLAFAVLLVGGFVLIRYVL